MDNLKVLYLQNNPICKKIPNYRKTLISRIKKLKYLDDRPVFEKDRRFAEAFYFKGLEGEKIEREKYKLEEKNKHLKMHNDFKEKYMKNEIDSEQ